MSRLSKIKNCYALKPDFVLRELGGEFIAVNVHEEQADPSRVVFLNERCCFLWRKLEEQCTLAQMMEALMKKFGIDDEEAEADTGEFIAKLKHAGMVE